MDPLLDELRAVLADLVPVPPATKLYATAVEDPRADLPRDGAYWAANLRNPVRLAAAVDAAVDDGYRVFLELSAHPVVAHSINETLRERGVEDAFVTGSLRRAQPERETLLGNLGALHCHGAALTVDAPGTLVALPRIAWQHKRYWREPNIGGTGGIAPHDPASLHLLGTASTAAGTPPLRLWRTRLDFDTRPYPGRHPVHGVEILPAAVQLTTFFAATGTRALTDVSMRTPVTLTPPREVQVVEQGGALRLASRPAGDDDADWEVHTTAQGGTGDLPAAVDVAALRAGCPDPLPPGSIVERLHSVGVDGSGFPWTVDELSTGDGGVLAGITAGDTATVDAVWSAVVDAVTTVGPLCFPGAPVLRLATDIARIALADACPATVLVHARRSSEDRVDAVVLDDAGTVLGVLDGLRYVELDGGTAAGNVVHELVETADGPRLVPVHGAGRDTVRCRPDSTYVVTGSGPLARQVAGWLAERGARRVVLPGAAPREGWTDLERAGVTVRTAVDSELPPVRGVAHARDGEFELSLEGVGALHVRWRDVPADPGIVALTETEALAALDQAWRTGAERVVLFRTVERDAADPVPPLLSQLRFGPEPDDGPQPDADPLSGLSPEELRERIAQEVAAHIAAEMRISPAELDPHRPLKRMGLDSVITLAIRRRLEKRFQLDLPATLMWQMPTAAAVADHLVGLLTTATVEAR
jgi:acyl carrier protein